MDWNAVGAVGEVVGAVAVLATLVYLASQIRQNTKAQETTSVWIQTQIFNQSHVSILENSEVAELTARAKREEFRDEVDVTRAYSLLMLILNGYNAAWSAYRNGHLPKDAYEELQRDSYILNVPGFRPLLNEALSMREPAFVEEFFQAQDWVRETRH